MLRLRKLLSLRGGDRRFLFKTFFLLGVIRLGLWMLPFRILLRIVERVGTSSTWRPRKRVSLGKVIWAVELSSCYMPGGAKCLARALTTKILLNRFGYSPSLKIGVAKGANGQLEAHAWIEHHGRVVMGNLADLSRFIPLPSIEELRP